MGAPAPEQPSLGLGLGTPSSPLLPYDDESNLKMTPAAVVERLNRFIIGQVLHREAESVWLPNARCSTRWHACLIHALNYTQDDAKKAVAVAFRNRWRRHRVQPQSLKAEIQPKNILMIGPTGGMGTGNMKLPVCTLLRSLSMHGVPFYQRVCVTHRLWQD